MTRRTTRRSTKRSKRTRTGAKSSRKSRPKQNNTRKQKRKSTTVKLSGLELFSLDSVTQKHRYHPDQEKYTTTPY